MDCQETKGLIEAYADGELDLGASVRLERHLEECKACTAALERIRSLRSVMEGASLYHQAPPQLRSRVRSALRQEARVPAVSRVPFWRWAVVAAPVASIAILILAVVAVSRMPSKSDLVNQEIVSAHVRSLMGNHLMDFPSSNQHTVKPAFSGRLDFSPEVEDLSSHGFDLLGGRLDYVDRRPAAALVYQHGKHLVNLFIWPAEAGSGARSVETSLRGYNLIHWVKEGMNYEAVSDLNATELREFRVAWGE